MLLRPDISIEEYFSYHPVMTDERRDKHNRVNNAALEYAKLIVELLQDEDPEKIIFLSQIQYIRMMLNQEITMQELDQDKISG